VQVIGFGNRKLSIAVTYKWSWASALENRDQVPSNLPCFLGFGHIPRQEGVDY